MWGAMEYAVRGGIPDTGRWTKQPHQALPHRLPGVQQLQPSTVFTCSGPELGHERQALLDQAAAPGPLSRGTQAGDWEGLGQDPPPRRSRPCSGR